MFSTDRFKTKSIETSSKINLIGKGASGCIIKPPITENYTKEYIPYINASADDVGKLFRPDLKNAFKTELNIFAAIHEKDPQHIFTVALKGANAIDKSLIVDSDILQCLRDNNSYFMQDNMFYQIIMEYGGKELSDITKNSVSYAKFMQLLYVFLTGIKYMHSLKIIHRDIKPSNVLLSDSKMSLIDFGISEEAQNVYNKDNKKYLSYIYVYYPPEFYMAGLLLKYRNDKARFAEKLDTVLDVMQEEYFHEIFKDVQIYNIRNELQDFINEIKLKNYAYNDIFNENLAFKCDIYGIGFLIREMGNKLSYNSDKEKIVIYNLYKMCTEINPYKRASIDSLISYINTSTQLLDTINNYQMRQSTVPQDNMYQNAEPMGQLVNAIAGGNNKKWRLTFPKIHTQNNEKILISPPKSKKAYKAINNS